MGSEIWLGSEHEWIARFELADELKAQGKAVHLIGGAFEAGELDAKKAIDMNSGEFGSAWVGRVNQEYEDKSWQDVIAANKKNYGK